MTTPAAVKMQEVGFKNWIDPGCQILRASQGLSNVIFSLVSTTPEKKAISGSDGYLHRTAWHPRENLPVIHYQENTTGIATTYRKLFPAIDKSMNSLFAHLNKQQQTRFPLVSKSLKKETFKALEDSCIILVPTFGYYWLVAACDQIGIPESLVKTSILLNDVIIPIEFTEIALSEDKELVSVLMKYIDSNGTYAYMFLSKIHTFLREDIYK